MRSGFMWFRYHPNVTGTAKYQLQPDAGMIYKILSAWIVIDTSATAGTRTLTLYWTTINNPWRTTLLQKSGTTTSGQLIARGSPWDSTADTTWSNYPELYSEQQLIIDYSGLVTGDNIEVYIDIEVIS